MTESIQRHTNLMANPATTLPVILLIFPLVSLAGELRSLSHTIDPIEISGSAISDITGTMISNLRIVASRDGEFASIPFQLDHKGSENDWIWGSVINNETSSQIEVNTHDDQDPLGVRIFDANDVVVFQAKDAGDKDRKGIGRVLADRLVELELTDPVDGGKDWVYLAYFVNIWGQKYLGSEQKLL